MSANRGNHQQRKTTMENKTTLHPIHPTLQFEAKHAIRFLDNLLKTRTTAVNGGGDLFGAVGVFATGRDITRLCHFIFQQARFDPMFMRVA